MVTEKIKEIKEAEEKADRILKDAESKASFIKGSLSEKGRRFDKEKDSLVKEQSGEYREAVEREKEIEIQKLIERYTIKKENTVQEFRKKNKAVVESVWEYIKKEVFTE